MSRKEEDIILAVVNAKENWGEYAKNNLPIIENLVELTGSELKAVMILLLSVVGSLDEIAEILGGDEDGEA